MSTCQNCGHPKNPRFLIDGLCPQCRENPSRNITSKSSAHQQSAPELADTVKRKRTDSILLTTETCLTGVNITRRLGVVTSEASWGLNIVKDVFINARDMFGGNSKTLDSALNEANALPCSRLKEKAYALGGNAVVGVTINFSSFSSNPKQTMIAVMASGTAVQIENVS